MPVNHQTQAACFLDTLPLVHNHEVCFPAEGQKNGFGFTGIQTRQRRRSGSLRQGNDLKPGRPMGDPEPHRFRRRGVVLFGGNRIGNEHLGVKRREEILLGRSGTR